MTKITKILIANRGEIACRVIKTARHMGIKTVAVYSDADANALHVRMADEAIHIGASPAAESYLVIDKIIDACKQSGADAVHPGYGFLSENPAFARRLKKEKIIFIGPAPESMEAMGLKDAAKKLMNEAGVPTTPGYLGDKQDVKTLELEAEKIGYPVLIKAVAGGGGKGMRKVENTKDFKAMLESCQREAKSSFGDDRVILEKYITAPRHIEVQVFGDQHGNVVHMFERDCSLQRRHQKVIEEAPAPGMTDAVRKAMTGAAVRAAKAVDYVGAGTVEFIVDGSGKLKTDGFWFMEMNTRLQVEHPVTEMITGLDLVEMQIRVAQGEKLPAQDDIKMNGHAVEARLYAEDPANDFLPSVGPLDILTLPGLHRVDTGVEQGGDVSLFYDPMISKLIVRGQNRSEAISSLADMCAMTQVYPIKSNAQFLFQCLAAKSFASGDISTNFIAENIDTLVPTGLSDIDLKAISKMIMPRGESLFSAADGWRVNQAPRDTYYKIINGNVTALPLEHDYDETRISASRHETSDGTVICVNGMSYLVEERQTGAAAGLVSNTITAPMPGKIIAVNVKPGDTVKAGDAVIIMEAMKMEMTLEAPKDGRVDSVNTDPDALVAQGDILLEMDE
jgi:3-methylcrotonyl-CoA carboxylase alpha subunit